MPDNRKLHIDVYIPAGKEMGAVTGHKVVAGLTSYGDDRHKPEGVITEILGHQNDPGTDILSVIKAYDLPYAFPPDVMEEVARIPQVVLPSEKEGRRDLRHLLTITIDGEDAKDLDDAVTLEIKGQAHFLLGVHIADVTHYVRENTKLDQEAYLRGTSCYLVDRVIPMLPHRLSNGICSLNVGEDRLALSCLMEIDNQGHVVDHEIVESLIHVDRRMSYTEVYALFTQDEKRNQLKAENPPLLDMLLQMRECASFLRKARMKRGALDFDFPEAKIRLNAKGIPVEIYPYVHNEATGLIEDFMIAANETVAEDFYWRGVPFLYRNHEKPDEEKMEQFIAFLHHYGITLHPQNREVHPKELQKVMEKIKGTEEELLLSRLMLRALRQARYAPERLGHYGLASKYYTHFTSPIRRYPDLQIHRIIKACLRHTLTEKQQNRLEKRMPEVGIHTSMTERRADEVEREVEKIKKAQYMENHIGEIFTGVISGVTNYGLYVELSNTVEGFIHVSRLKGDYFHFDSESYALVGEMTNRRFQLGQKVQVRVENADHFIPQVEFSPAGEPMENRITGKKNGKRQH